MIDLAREIGLSLGRELPGAVHKVGPIALAQETVP